MSNISNLNNKNDDLIELNKKSFDTNSFNFDIPHKQNRVTQNNFIDDDVLFNKSKISSDVMSMSSRSSSRASSVSGKGDREKYMKNKSRHDYNKKSKDYDTDSSKSSSKSSNSSKSSKSSKGSIASKGNESNAGSFESNESEEQDESVKSYNESEGSKIIKKRNLSPKEIIKNEINEKKEIIYQLDRLESKGFKVPFKFNMNSDFDEMKSEYNRIIREKELDGSVRFQQKMLMAFISGTEYMNSRYDPFTIKLDGWSEQVNENINDYDDIFEELHCKYKSTGKKMAPELRLFISLSGSAFMFHLTSRMFKEQPMPDVENVLKSDPELMKQFQNAAAKQYMMGNNKIEQPMKQTNSGSDSMGLFNMVSNIFGTLNGGSMSPDIMPRQMPSSNNMNANYGMNNNSINRPEQDVDNIIRNMHSKISVEDNDDNIETLSVSDEEITSILEDTADIKILRQSSGGRPRKNTRTLNL
jgi:hypothetical protein